MSKFIPHSKQVQPRWVYLANPKTGEVTREKKFNFMTLYSLQDQGFKATSRGVYMRFVKGTGTTRSFIPTEYPRSSGRYLPSNINFTVKH